MTIQIAHWAPHSRHGGHTTRHTTRLQIRSGRLLNDELSSSQRQTQTQTNPFYSVLDRFPVGNPSVAAGVSDSDMVTTTLIPIPYYSSSSTSPLKQPTTSLDSSALPTASTPLAPTKVQLGFQSSSSPAQPSPSQRLPSGPTTISFTSVTPAATLANSRSQKGINLISSSTMNPFSLPRVATETALPEVVTISLSASVSITSIKLWSTVVPSYLPTTSLNDADVSSHTTDLGRPAAKAVGNALSYQTTFGAPSSTPTIPFALYPHQGHHLRLNPVMVVGCVLAGILSLTVAFFCIVWVLRARRRSRDDRMAIH